MRPSLLSLLVLLGFLVAPGAVFADTWDVKAGAGPVYGSTFHPNEPDGLGFTVYVELGLTEILSLTVDGGYIRHFLCDGTKYDLSHTSLGIQASLDVLTVVPYLSLRIGWLGRMPDEGESATGLGLAVAVGFDVLWTDSFTFGFAADYHGLLTDFAAFPGHVAFTGRVGFRLPY